jgi:hypothetical protein
MDIVVIIHHFFVVTEIEVRASLVGSGNMISICTCLTQLDQHFVQTFGVLLLDHILLIVLKFLSDEATVNNFHHSFISLLIYDTFSSHLFKVSLALDACKCVGAAKQLMCLCACVIVKQKLM